MDRDPLYFPAELIPEDMSYVWGNIIKMGEYEERFYIPVHPIEHFEYLYPEEYNRFVKIYSNSFIDPVEELPFDLGDNKVKQKLQFYIDISGDSEVQDERERDSESLHKILDSLPELIVRKDVYLLKRPKNIDEILKLIYDLMPKYHNVGKKLSLFLRDEVNKSLVRYKKTNDFDFDNTLEEDDVDKVSNEYVKKFWEEKK